MNEGVDLSDLQRKILLDLRGGCMCPLGKPPCGACTECPTDEELEIVSEKILTTVLQGGDDAPDPGEYTSLTEILSARPIPEQV